MPDTCVSLLQNLKRIVRVATLWELLALLEGRDVFDEMRSEHGDRPVITWGTRCVMNNIVHCTPALHRFRGGRGSSLELPSDDDPYPIEAYSYLVVVE